jgi:hypothetical protein
MHRLFDQCVNMHVLLVQFVLGVHVACMICLMHLFALLALIALPPPLGPRAAAFAVQSFHRLAVSHTLGPSARLAVVVESLCGVDLFFGSGHVQAGFAHSCGFVV